MELMAPAKINLSLKILGKRPDGFHELETFMAPISLADRLVLGKSSKQGLHFSCSDQSLPVDSSNLAVRAAEVFCERLGVEPAVEIYLEKRIPHGAGLGGGSSDAAAVLMGLDELFKAGLGIDALSELAARLGSDIPFFLYQSAAICRGRGERVEPVVFEEALPLLLIKPSFGVQTPWAYQRWNESLRIPGVPYEPQSFSWGELYNDLERPVFEKHFVLAELKRWLLDQPETAGALMSGSGSTSFAVLRNAREATVLAEKVHQQFGAEFWTAQCQTLASR